MDAQQKSRPAGKPDGSKPWTRGDYTASRDQPQRFDASQVKSAAQGRWREILIALGMDASCLTNRHGPCPFCGGRDRWRWDDQAGHGSGICSQCGSGDGFTLAGKLLGLDPKADFPEVLERVADVAGIDHARSPEPRRRTSPRPTTRADEPPSWLSEGPPDEAYDDLPKIEPDACSGETAVDPDAHPGNEHATGDQTHDRAAKAAELARKVWNSARPAETDNPYLIRKQVPQTDTLREVWLSDLKHLIGYHPRGKGGPLQDGRVLIVPIKRDGRLTTVEMIDELGGKSSLAGGVRAGGFWAAQPLLDGDGSGRTILLGEGVATVLSAVQATDGLGVAALSSGNLVGAARTLRARYPKGEIVLLADLIKTTGEPDLHAIEAARAVGGLLAIPSFGDARPEGMNDCNDLARLFGLPSVRACIDAADLPVEDEGEDEESSNHSETPEGERDEKFTLDDHLVDFTLEGDQDDAPTFAVDKILPHGEVALLAGHGGSGKSFASLMLAVHVACGKSFGPLHVRAGRVLFVSAEDPGRTLRHRLGRICRAYGVDMKELRDRLQLLDLSNTDAALHRADRNRSLPTKALDQIADLVDRYDLGLVILDNASDLFDGDEIKRAHVRAFLRDVRSRLAGPTRAVLLLGHVSKPAAVNSKTTAGQDFSGSTAWHNSVRSRLSLVPGKGGLMTIEHQKSNLGRTADPIHLRWNEDGVPEFGETPSQEKSADETEVRRALVDVIGTFDLRGERLPTAMTGPVTAFKLMKDAPGFPGGLDGERFVRVMRELERDQVIFRSSIRTGDYKKKETFTLRRPGSGPSHDQSEGF